MKLEYMNNYEARVRFGTRVRDSAIFENVGVGAGAAGLSD